MLDRWIKAIGEKNPQEIHDRLMWMLTENPAVLEDPQGFLSLLSGEYQEEPLSKEQARALILKLLNAHPEKAWDPNELSFQVGEVAGEEGVRRIIFEMVSNKILERTEDNKYKLIANEDELYVMGL